MTTPALLPRQRRMNVALFTASEPGAGQLAKYNATQATDGNWQVKNFPIFKAGSFKDSMGEMNTWDQMHLDQMVSNYTMLKNHNIFPNVPVREGHRSIFSAGGRVVGYFDNVHTGEMVDPSDGQRKLFLLCDFTFTDPIAAQSFDSGTYRSRSAEVGMYESNSGASYWPTCMGFAFVDIPAVEGLHESSNASQEYTVLFDKEQQVTTPAPPATPPTQPETQPTPPPAAPATPPAPAPAPETSPGTPTPPATPPAPAPAAPAQETSDHSRPPQVFTVNGQATSDFGAVQAHIVNLEQFRKETLETGRKNFVTALAADRKIAAPQIESLTAHALSLSDEQFDGFKASWEAAPANPLFAAHGGSTTPQVPGSTPAPGTPGTGTGDQKEILEERIKMHQRAGMTQEQVEKTESWKQLQALTKSTN